MNRTNNLINEALNLIYKKSMYQRILTGIKPPKEIQVIECTTIGEVLKAFS